MTHSFVDKKPKDFFEEKEAILRTTYTNYSNEVIKAGERVTIIGKSERSKYRFNVKNDDDIHIYNIHCEELTLIN